MSGTIANGAGDDASPPTKRVKTDDVESNGIDAGPPGTPAFLTPPTSASVPAPPSEGDDDDDAAAAAHSPSATMDLSSAIGREEDRSAAAAPASVSREASPPAGTATVTSSSSSSSCPSCRRCGTPVAAAAATSIRGGDGGGGGGCDSGSSPSSKLSPEDIRALLREEAGYDVDDPKNARKRAGYLTWDDYFMAVAALSAQRSKDPHSQVGACIVDGDNRIVGIGYNGFPRGCPDDCLPWAANETEAGGGNPCNGTGTGQPQQRRRLSPLHTRDPFMCHAEVNAILNKCSSDVAGARMYVARFPCNECAKLIVQSRIREVVYLDEGCPGSDACRASRIMFEMAGVSTRQHRPTNSSVTLDFGPLGAVVVEEEEEGAGGGRGRQDGKDGALSEQAKYRDMLLREAGYDPTKQVVPKRAGYLSWDAYFMAISFLSSQRSKDPNTQVGACIVNADKCIIGIGYNGFPRGCSDECLPWSRKADSDLHKKYVYVCHAEANAILNKCSADVRGATLYVALFPCNECAKLIVQAGISEVVFLNDQYHDTDGCRASRIMFKMAGVKLRQYRPDDRFMTVDLGNSAMS